MSGNTYITKAFRLNSALQFVESLTEPANNMYYVFVGRHLPFVNDNEPPRVSESTFGLVTDVYDNMIYAKNVDPSDVTISTKKVLWSSGTVYAAYDDQVTDLYNTQFFIAYKDGSTYKVYKCLGNNKGAPSTIPPTSTSATDNQYYTSDGYQWKWMYSVSETEWNKFASATHMPVVPNSTVIANAKNGSIDAIKVVAGGTGFNSYNSGLIQVVAPGGNQKLFVIEPSAASNTNFYTGCSFQLMSGAGAGQTRRVVQYTVNGSVKTIEVDSAFSPPPTSSDLYEISPSVIISGDGAGATARAIINATSNSIHRVEVVSGGENYTWAQAITVGNTGIVVGGNTQPAGSNVVPVISPTGGHGANPYLELGAASVTISVDFNDSLSGSIIRTQNDVRTFGLIQDVLFANVALGLTSLVGSFTVGETVTQTATLATGKVTSANTSEIKLTNVRGYFKSSNDIVGSASLATANVTTVTSPGKYINTTLTLLVDSPDGSMFQLDELVTQGSFANGYIQSVTNISGDTYEVRLTNVRGTFNVTDDALDLEQSIYGITSTVYGAVTEVRYSDIVRPTGTVLFVDNITPVSKSVGQIETTRFTLDF